MSDPRQVDDARLRVLLAGQHPACRNGLRAILEEKAGAEVVAGEATPEDVLQALRSVRPDVVVLDAALVEGVARTGHRARGVRGERDGRRAVESLSPRERQVLVLTVQGYSASEIGERLAISPKTVETYRSRLMSKLRLSHRAEAFRLALDAGLLDGLGANS